VFLYLLGKLAHIILIETIIITRTPLISADSSNTDEGARWSALLTVPGNTSAPNATESTVFNFLQGQFDGLTRQSVNQAIEEFYPLVEYNNSPSLQGQQMYGEARFICTAAMIAGSLSPYQKTYQYQ
jgi:hypothetical protein